MSHGPEITNASLAAWALSPSRATPSTSIDSSVTLYSPENWDEAKTSLHGDGQSCNNDKPPPVSDNIADQDSSSLTLTPSPTFHNPAWHNVELSSPTPSLLASQNLHPPPQTMPTPTTTGNNLPTTTKTVRWQHDVNENSNQTNKYKQERSGPPSAKYNENSDEFYYENSDTTTIHNNGADDLPLQPSSSLTSPSASSTTDSTTASSHRPARVTFQQQPVQEQQNQARRSSAAAAGACAVSSPRRAADIIRSMAYYGEVITVSLFKVAFLIGFPLTTILIAADNWVSCPCEEMLPVWLAVFGAIDLCINLLTWYTSRLATRRTLAPWCATGSGAGAINNPHSNASKRNTHNMPAGSVLERLACTTENVQEQRKLSTISQAAYILERRGSTASQTALTTPPAATALEPSLPTIVEIVRSSETGRRLSSSSIDNNDNTSLHSSLDEEEAVSVPIMATSSSVAVPPSSGTLDSAGGPNGGASLDRKASKMLERAERDVRWPEDWWTWSFVLVNILVSAIAIAWLVYGCIIIHRTMNVIDLRRHSPRDQYCDPVLFYYTFCLIAFAICVGFMVFIFSCGRFVWVKFMAWRRRRRDQDWDRRLASF